MNSSAKETISPFERLLAELTGAGVDYAVVGGVAVIANGYVRLTEDLKQDSWRDRDKIDVLAMKEILARESRSGNP